LAQHGEYVKRAEAAGYTDLWSSETAGADGFTPLSLSAAWSPSLRLGTGIAGVFQRGPALLAQEAAALTDASDGRFVLGLGVSSDRIVEGWNGIPFKRPLTKMGQTLDFLDDALVGRRTETGFKLEAAPLHPTPVVLAALRGKMLELAVERADGAFTNYLPLRGLPQVRESLARAPEGFELLCRFFCFPGAREEVEPIMRRLFAAYITVPVYREFFRWLGLGEEIAPMVDLWAAGDRQGAAAAAPWELIAETFLFGSPEEIVEQAGAFVEGGVTLPVLCPLVEPEWMAEAITTLAPPAY
jgi:probable F420-dependent oxidoreductase